LAPDSNRAKRRIAMIDRKPGQTPVFAKLTPEMTRNQKLGNLTAALKKSGFKVLPGRRSVDQQPAGSKPRTIIPAG
jgi:hypothetical protein